MSQTLYKDTLKLPKGEAGTATQAPKADVQAKVNKGSKVNRICDAFLAALRNKIDTNLHNLVTAHVCKRPPDLDAGLQLVARLRGIARQLLHQGELSELTDKTAERSSEQAEEAIEHMCFLTDANQLYHNALGLYDLELTLLVAQQAQRVRLTVAQSVGFGGDADVFSRTRENISRSYGSYSNCLSCADASRSITTSAGSRRR